MYATKLAEHGPEAASAMAVAATSPTTTSNQLQSGGRGSPIKEEIGENSGKTYSTV